MEFSETALHTQVSSPRQVLLLPTHRLQTGGPPATPLGSIGLMERLTELRKGNSQAGRPGAGPPRRGFCPRGAWGRRGRALPGLVGAPLRGRD